uniref:BTB domain-containing protein n=1 Tax=Caenorhabditis tropicalis TaxID=1561998 RepID=A0A1I7T9Y4_9PELO
MLDKYRADECIKRLDHQLINLGISDDMGMLKLNDMYQLTQMKNQGNQILSILSERTKSPQISFKEFSDPSDMVTFNFKDNRIFYSSKQILANASVYFMKRFFGPNAKYDDNTIIFDDVTSQNFNVLMNHIYHPNIAITGISFVK